MARYRGPREKIERRIGEHLFLKGERSYSPKAGMTKRPYPPGVHTRRAMKKSEFGQQLISKQKVRAIYRLLEKQFKAYIKKAVISKTDSYTGVVEGLEGRLDNVVFRGGFAQSRDQARQIVGHGHILVNGKKVNIPSYQVRRNEVISLREGSKKSVYFSNLMPQWFAKVDAPDWLEVNKDKIEIKVKSAPTLEASGLKIDDLQAIIEYYSR
jgi:small subunit ribosomal protein S4